MTCPSAEDAMPPRNLLLCFDAFGTLFRPRRPVAQQYGDVARALGHSGFSDDDVQNAFKVAFKNESKRNPNYGKANGLNAEQWWTSIIQNTFRPLLGPGEQLHHDVVPKLLHRFWCDEGYVLFPDVVPLLQRLRDGHSSLSNSSTGRVVVGVITNSDDRVPDVLSALGVKVNPRRYGSLTGPPPAAAPDYDVDFSVMSYDVGYEKPHRRIFAAAEEVLKAALESDLPAGDDADRDVQQWRKLYVGDEYDKDVVGALDAGWNAVLIDRESAQKDSVMWLDGQHGSLWEAFQTSRAVGFSSLAEMSKWLPSAN